MHLLKGKFFFNYSVFLQHIYQMNFIERMIIKKIAQKNTSIQRIDKEAINSFVEQF